MVDEAGLPRELRLALAMKGGVSLAVWMGGACREIARLREESAAPESDDRQPRYQALLRLCGYDSVLVDVLAGSSAGGLNGVLLGQNIASGARFDEGVREIWLRVADLHQLARRPWSDPPLSLLLGDKAFYPRLVRAMRKLATSDPTRVATHPLRLLVTATRLHGRTKALFPTIGGPLLARSSAGFCRFRYPGLADALYVSRRTDHDHAINDFIDSDLSARRLAYAARTTSSFPGAFEPALPWVLTDDPLQEVDLFGISSETGTEDPARAGRVELVDGGLLDNIPIAWAIRSMAGMPASAPVDRWLIYLDPVPTSPPENGNSSHSVLGMIKLLTTSLMVKTRSESVLDDALALSQAADLTNAQEASIGATLSLAGSEGLRDAAGEQVDPTYVRMLGQMEISRLRQLVLDPFSLVGPDPLPVPPDTFPRDQLEAMDGSGRHQAPLLKAVPDPEAALLAGPLQSTDVQGLLGERALTPFIAARGVTLLLESVLEAERRGQVIPAGLRERLYAVRLATEMVVAARDRLLLRLAGDHLRHVDTSGGPPAPVALIQEATRELTTLLASLDDVVDDGDNLGQARFWRRWAYDLAAAVAERSAVNHHTVAQRGLPQSPSAAPYAVLWEAVLGCHQAYALVEAPDRAPSTGQHSERAMMAETLCSLEVLGGGLRPDPLSSPSIPQFAVLSARNRSPLEDRLIHGPVTNANRVDLKLSGNQIANFAGFLSARWRDNDWIWGRLDGAQTLATLIATDVRVKRALAADAGSTDPRRVLREFFVGAPQDPSWAEFFQKRWCELEAELASGDRPIEAWFAEVATERLQWDILATEMGRFLELEDRISEQDDPPDDDEAPEQVPPPSADAGNRGPMDRLQALGAVGEESALELVRRAEQRRTLVQLALIIWRALVGTADPGEADQETLWRKARRLGGWAVAPVIVPPLLFSLISPIATVFAVLFLWVAIAAVTGVWGSPAHLPLILGLGLASLVIVAHAGLRRWLLQLLPLLVIILGIAGWIIAYRFGWRFPITTDGGQVHWGGLLAGFAFQYVALALSLVGLYVWADKSATVQQPLDPLVR